MSKKILIIFTIIICVLLATETKADFLRLALSYDQGNISWGDAGSGNIELIKDLNFIEPTAGDYEITLQSFKGVVLEKFKAELKPTICYDSIDPKTQKLTGFCEELEKGATGVDIPYYPNAQMANIFDASGKLVFSANLSAFAVCNENNTCESNLKETKETCPEDCLKQKTTSWFLVLIIIGVALLFLVLILVFLIKKVKSRQSL